MAVHELTEEQIRTWTLEEKDRWWLENVYRGAMPQLTIRSAATGMLLGGVLSLTNLYIGAKTGWTLGVGITSVILAFAMFKVLSKLGWANEFTILENNAMQSIATAAGYMTSPMISSLAAYMMVTNRVIPFWQTMLWIMALAILGVLFAFPFKRRFINDEQQPFPEGRAAGIVMDSLHHGEAEASLLKAKLLVIMGVFAAVVTFLQEEAIVAWINAKSGFNWLFHLPKDLDWLYKLTGTPSILGTPITNLTLQPELDIPMIGAGGLMGIRTGFSMLLGAVINCAILAPIMIQSGDIVPNAKGIVTFKEITFWSLWCGVAMMTVASLLTFFAKPEIILSSFRGLWGGKPPREPAPEGPKGTFAEETATEEAVRAAETHFTDKTPPPEHPDAKPAGLAPAGEGQVLAHIELPLQVSLIGIPLLGLLVIVMADTFFGIDWRLSVVALALVFVFCLIAINSTGLTSITPIGAMGKLTQLTFGALAPGNREVNLMTAGITGEVASHSANLLMDIKPGYMLGAKPRQQAVGHVLGVIAGALLSVPVFYTVFLKDRDPSTDTMVPISKEQALSIDGPVIHGEVSFGDNPMPGATVWKAVADILAKGLETIPVSARWAALAGIIVGIVFELIRLKSQNKFPLSPVAIGLGFVIPFSTCLAMFLGSAIFWFFEKTYPDKESRVNQVVVQNQEPICAGLIAGGALMGIVVAVVTVFFLS